MQDRSPTLAIEGGATLTTVTLLSGTGSCCLGRRREGDPVKVGGRGHVIGDRGSASDIALHALRSVVTNFTTKLRDRAARIVSELSGAGEAQAREALAAEGWVVRHACERLARDA